MTETNLNYILIATIVILIIYFIIKSKSNNELFNNQHKVNNDEISNLINLMDKTENNTEDVKYIHTGYHKQGDEIKSTIKRVPKNKKIKYTNKEHCLYLKHKKNDNVLWTNIIDLYDSGKNDYDNGSNCPNFDIENKTDKYFRDIALGGKFLCGDKLNVKYSDKQIKEYQDEHFDFHDNINRSSSFETDPVDKLNMLHYQEGNEINNMIGNKISDVHDYITKNKAEHKNITNIPIMYEDENNNIGYQNMAQMNFNNIVSNMNIN